MYTTRVLTEADLPTLDAFLLRHADSSMILRGNLRHAGVVDRGERFQGPYAGAFDRGGELRAVAAQYQNGVVFAASDAEPALDAALRAVVAASGRPVKGVIGLRAIVGRALEALGLQSAPAQLDANEGLYALDLARLGLPPLLGDARFTVRALRAEDQSVIVAFYRDYEINTLNAADTPQLTSQCEQRFAHALADGRRILLTRDGEPCAISGFNALLPDRVQVGGVYTPPHSRSRGFARAAVAGSLRDARDRGATRAILFTGEHNIAAITAYEAIGFERIGDWRLVLLH